MRGRGGVSFFEMEVRGGIVGKVLLVKGKGMIGGWIGI